MNGLEFRPLYARRSSRLHGGAFRFLDVTATLSNRTAEILRENPGLTQAELARQAGVSKGLVTQWLDGTARSMSYDAAKRLALKYGYALDWLIKGVGQKRSRGKGVSGGPEITARVPLIPWSDAATINHPAGAYQSYEEHDWYPMPKRAGPNTYCLRVEGDAMTSSYGRSYPPGSIIFVDPDELTPASGARVIARLKAGEVTFRLFVQDAGRTFLLPLNAHYPPIHEHFKVIGTVIGKWEDD